MEQQSIALSFDSISIGVIFENNKLFEFERNRLFET